MIVIFREFDFLVKLNFSVREGFNIVALLCDKVVENCYLIIRLLGFVL